MNIKNIVAATLLTGAFMINAGFANASGSNCQIIYGGGQVCNNNIEFSLNKMVQVPGKGGGNFVDNLTVNDAKYAAGQNVPFRITVTNTGDTSITHIRVTDTLPQFLTFVSGDGNFDQNAKTITFDVNNLDVGKVQEFNIVAKVVDDSQLPQDQSTLCTVNQVQAIADNGDTASDSSQICIAKQITSAPTPTVFTTVPPKSIPNTGPEMLPLLGLIPAGLAGLKLRKKGKIN